MDTRLRERLQDLAGDAPRVLVPPPGLAARARRRALLTTTALVAAVAALITGSAVGARVLTRPNAIVPARHATVNLFEGIRGWITIGGQQLTAVDPAHRWEQVELTSDQGVVDSPLGWSSDGSQLLFTRRPITSNDTGPYDLYILHADGTESLLSQGGYVTGASFSPDGTNVIFGRDTGDGQGGHTSGIYVISAQGGTAQELTPNGTPTNYGGPIWSPDGSKIAFVGGSATNPSVDTMNPDGTNVRTILAFSDANLVDIAGLAWSPNGTQLAFGGMTPDFHTGQIFTIGADGSGLTQLTSEGNYNVWPSWSSYGTRIAFIGGGRLVMMDPDGSHIQRLGPADSEAGIAWDPFGG